MEWKLAGFMHTEAKEEGTHSWSFNKSIIMKSLIKNTAFDSDTYLTDNQSLDFYLAHKNSRN